MREKSVDILNELKQHVTAMIDQAKAMQSLSSDKLNTPPAPGKWSVIECFEHMNLYSNFYVQEFEYQITHSKHEADEFHSSSWIGKYSFKSMLPQNGKAPKAMNTFKYMNPTIVGTNNFGINQFIKQQEHVLQLLDLAYGVSLRKTKCKTTLKILKFNLGDALKFYVYHNLRHIHQAEKVLDLM